MSRAAIALGLALAAASAAEERPRDPGYRLGPFRVSPSLRLTAGVDTNVFNQRIDPTGDANLVASPAIRFAGDLRQRLRVVGQAGAAFNYYQREGSERFVDRFGDVRAELGIDRVTAFAGLGGGQHRDRFSIELDDRVLRQSVRAGAGLDARLSGRLRMSLAASGESHRYGPSIRGTGTAVPDELDRNVDTISAHVRWRVTGRTGLLAILERVEDRFAQPRANGRRELPSTRVLTGFETGSKALLSGRVTAGIRRYPALGAGSGGATVAVVSAAFSLPLPLLARLSFSADRDVSYSVGGGTARSRARDNANVYGTYRVSTGSELPFDLIGRAYLGWERFHPLLPVPNAEGGTRTDRREMIGGSLLRRLGDRLQAGGFAEYTVRRSQFATQSYTGWRYGFELRLQP